MEIDLTVFSNIANSLGKHFDNLYYVDIETNDYIEFIHPNVLASVNIPKSGKDFFVTSAKNAHNYIHPDDLADVLKIHDKENVLKKLSKNPVYSVSGRVVRDGKMFYARFVVVMCDDNKHILCGMENQKSEPFPYSLSTPMVPPMASHRLLDIASPSPVPSTLRFLLLSTCWKLTKSLLRSSSLIPCPVSFT